jgi:hypothetical protein
MRFTANAVGVLLIVPEHREGVSIIACQPIVGPEPEVARAILRHGLHIALGQAVLHGDGIEVDLHGVQLGVDATAAQQCASEQRTRWAQRAIPGEREENAHTFWKHTPREWNRGPHHWNQ